MTSNRVRLEQPSLYNLLMGGAGQEYDAQGQSQPVRFPGDEMLQPEKSYGRYKAEMIYLEKAAFLDYLRQRIAAINARIERGDPEVQGWEAYTDMHLSLQADKMFNDYRKRVISYAEQKRQKLSVGS